MGTRICGSMHAGKGIKNRLRQRLFADCLRSIDKKSSAELSEAINSMFRWYQQAAVCYVYLSDVCDAPCKAELNRQFRSSVWWSRGWTLQELLAPSTVLFYTAGWSIIGSEKDKYEEIAELTGIAKEFLLGKWPLSSASVATRMSWAARRVTEREEDIAYCLMGIFSVNMPLL